MRSAVLFWGGQRGQKTKDDSEQGERQVGLQLLLMSRVSKNSVEMSSQAASFRGPVDEIQGRSRANGLEIERSYSGG